MLVDADSHLCLWFDGEAGRELFFCRGLRTHVYQLEHNFLDNANRAIIWYMNYWLIKSEGSCYSIDDLKRDKKTAWTGIRNYQARNFMRNEMNVGDLVLFYHSIGSKTELPGIYGIAKVASKPHADETQFDTKDIHFEPRAKDGVPIWACVDVAFVKKLKSPVTLGDIKRDRHLEGMEVRRTGSRLSVMPVSEKHFTYITEKLAQIH